MTPGARIPPLIVVALVLHTAVLPHFRLFDTGADVLLLLGAATALVAGPERGALMSFACGLLADCFLQTPFGLSALAYCLVGWGVGVFQARILHATWWIPMLTAAVAAASGTLLYAALGAVVGQSQLVSMRLLTIVPCVALLDALLTPLAVRAMRWVFAVEQRGAMLVVR